MKVGSSKIGFQVNRSVAIEGRFRRDMERYHDAHWAPATVESQGQKNLVHVVFAGTDERGLSGTGDGGRLLDEELEEIRALLALVELVHRPASALHQKKPPTVPIIHIHVPHPSGFKEWSIEEIRKYAQGQLQGYEIIREGQTWKAKPKV